MLLSSPLSAHEGHDHGKQPVIAASAAKPRVSVQSPAYELAGIFEDDKLSIFLDRFDTNQPVPGAKISVMVGGDAEMAAKEADAGIYVLQSEKFLSEGPLELVFSVAHPSGDDLLIGSIELPRKSPVQADQSRTQGRGLESIIPEKLALGDFEVDRLQLLAGGFLGFGFLAGLMARKGRRAAPIAGLVLVVLMATTAFAFSHEGHDHSEASTPLPAGDAPQRMSDGDVFLPKPSQRLLSIRTVVAKPEQAQSAVTLVGRIVADPNRSGLVQSINGGRIMVAGGALPRLGQTVSKGEVLALVEQAMSQADRSSLSERIGEIEQEIAVAEAKLTRTRDLAGSFVAPKSQVTDAETELAGLRRRREILLETTGATEVLKAPIDGVVAAVKAVPGQVVGSVDVVFQIVDPSGLWVEALVYADVEPGSLGFANATTSEGTAIKLSFQGFGKTLQQQARVVQFSVENPDERLAVGQPVTVRAFVGKPVSGFILPRSAVVRGGNGETIVWLHAHPERFAPKPVHMEAFDAERVVIRAGLSEGERVVVQGSELINQIR